jgi:uncharacterized protein
MSAVEESISGLDRIDDSLLQKIVETIVKRCDPRRIVLFGSRARGDARPDSDIDLFVEMETPDSPHERKLKIRSLFPDRRWGLDLVVYTPDEVLKYRPMRGLLLSMIEAEGKTLYEQSAARS